MNDVFDMYKKIALSNGETFRDQLLNDFRNEIDEGISNLMTFSTFLVNDIEYGVSIQDVNDQNNKDIRDDKYLICSLDCPVKSGDIGIWKEVNKPYLVVSEEYKTVRANKRLKLYPCNYLLKWVDFENNTVRESYCVFSDATIYTDGVKDETRVRYPEEMARIILPKSVEISKFKRGQRLCVDSDYFEITSIKRIEEGIVRLMLSAVQKSEYDDDDLCIADYKRLVSNQGESVPPVSNDFKIEIKGKKSIFVNQQSEYKAVVKNQNDEILSDKVVSFEYPNNLEEVLLNGNKIVLKAKSTGKVKIKAVLDGYSVEYEILIRRL